MQHQNLWAPWRFSYIKQMSPNDPSSSTQDSPQDSDDKPAGCFLCQAAAATPGSQEAQDRLVIARDQRGLILLNRYPYTNGHLLVAPTGHLADLADLDPDRQSGLMALIVLAQQLLRAAVNPQGMNIGFNLGRCAGAGLPGHLHAHVVPRWGGDTNYMQTVGQIRVIPQALEESYAMLSEAYHRLDHA